MSLINVSTAQQARTKALSVYKKFFDRSIMSKAPYYPVLNFDGFIKAIDRFGIIEDNGDIWYTVSDDNMNQAIKDAVAKKQTSYTWAANDLSKEMSKYINSSSNASTLGYASKAINETGKEIGNDIVEYSQVFTKVVLWGAVIYALGYVLISIGGVKTLKEIGKSLKG